MVAGVACLLGDFENWDGADDDCWGLLAVGVLEDDDLSFVELLDEELEGVELDWHSGSRR